MGANTDKKEHDVTVYSTEWCGFCHSLKQYLDQKQVSYTDKNIETDESAYNELMDKLGGRDKFAGVPVTDVNGELVLGFDRGKLNTLLEIS
jgi:glutaredoxin-like YruB-family protein